MAPKTKINLKDRFENGELDLSMSDLQEVPVKEIATVKKATSLDLSNNRLITLGKTFVTLTHIIKLDLSKNLLRELPEDFGQMKQLKHLDLYSNQISHLPLSFCELKNLRWLDLKNNPLVPAVAKIVGPCLDAQQCQQSARATVAFLTEMKDQVEEEKVRLREQEQRDLEAQQDKERQTKKRNERKKAARQKKKEINKKEVEREVKEDKVVENEVLDNGSAWKTTKSDQKSKPDAIKKSRCSLFTFLLLAVPSLTILLFLLSASGLLGATGDIYRGQIVLAFNRTVQNLPEPYRIYGSRFSHAISELHTLTGRLIDNAVDVVTDAAQHKNVKYAMEVLSEAFVVGYDWSSQMFRTLSNKVLVITDEIVKKLT